MKKALTLLAVAAMAAVSFVGCSKTYDVDASLETGTDNYDFSGKTFVSTAVTGQITKTVTDTAAKTQVVSKIDSETTTTTFVFNADGTYTKTVTVAYTAAIDGDYRTTTSGTVTTAYTGLDNGVGKYTGLANAVQSVTVTSGTWKTFDRQDNAIDGTTLNYQMIPGTVTTTGTGYTDDGGTAITDSLGGTLYTYTKTGTQTSTVTQDVTSIYTLAYTYLGTNSSDKDIVKIDGNESIEQ